MARAKFLKTHLIIAYYSGIALLLVGFYGVVAELVGWPRPPGDHWLMIYIAFISTPVLSYIIGEDNLIKTVSKIEKYSEKIASAEASRNETIEKVMDAILAREDVELDIHSDVINYHDKSLKEKIDLMSNGIYRSKGIDIRSSTEAITRKRGYYAAVTSKDIGSWANPDSVLMGYNSIISNLAVEKKVSRIFLITKEEIETKWAEIVAAMKWSSNNNIPWAIVFDDKYLDDKIKHDYFSKDKIGDVISKDYIDMAVVNRGDALTFMSEISDNGAAQARDRTQITVLNNSMIPEEFSARCEVYARLLVECWICEERFVDLSIKSLPNPGKLSMRNSSNVKMFTKKWIVKTTRELDRVILSEIRSKSNNHDHDFAKKYLAGKKHYVPIISSRDNKDIEDKMLDFKKMISIRMGYSFP